MQFPELPAAPAVIFVKIFVEFVLPSPEGHSPQRVASKPWHVKIAIFAVPSQPAATVRFPRILCPGPSDKGPMTSDRAFA
jgi:hypothetical protein